MPLEPVGVGVGDVDDVVIVRWGLTAPVFFKDRGRPSPTLSGVDLPLQRTPADTSGRVLYYPESTCLYSGRLRIRVARFAGHTAGGRVTHCPEST